MQVVDNSNIGEGGAAGAFKVSDRSNGFSFTRTETVGNTFVFKIEKYQRECCSS